MRKIKLGIVLGIIAGVLDTLPMILQKMKWDSNLSALSHWILVGFLISTTNLNLKGPLKGLIIAIITLIPLTFIVWWNDSSAIIPMTISTIILGTGLGYFIEKYGE